MANCNHPLFRLIFLLDNTKKECFFQEQDISEGKSLSIGPLQTRPGFKGRSATYELYHLGKVTRSAVNQTVPSSAKPGE